MPRRINAVLLCLLLCLSCLSPAVAQVQFGSSFGGAGGGGNLTAQYLLQVPDVALPNAQALSALGTGLLVNTTGTGVLSAYPGSTLGANQFATGLSVSGVLSGAQPAFTNLSGSLACGQTPALTGDVTTSAGSCATSLSTTAVSPASYGDATHIPTFTVDANGRLTAAGSTTFSAGALPAGSGTELAYRLTANTFGALSGSSVSGSTLTLTSPAIANIIPGANFTLTLNGVAALTAENAAATANTLYLKAGKVGIRTANPAQAFEVSGAIRSGSGLDYIDVDAANKKISLFVSGATTHTIADTGGLLRITSGAYRLELDGAATFISPSSGAVGFYLFNAYGTPSVMLTVAGTVVLGSGDGSTPTGVTMRGPNAAGTNIAGVITGIASSLGTGTGNIGVTTIQAATSKQVSGTTAHTTAVIERFGQNQNAHPGLIGFLSSKLANTITDENTAASGTASTAIAHAIGAPTFAARNTLVTNTDAASLYVAAPLAGTNVTATNLWGVWNAGNSRVDGLLRAANVSLPTTGGAATSGNAVLVSGTVTVSTTAALTSSVLLLTRKTSGGTIGTSITYTINNGVGFTITSDNILDTSTFTWAILQTY